MEETQFGEVEMLEVRALEAFHPGGDGSGGETTKPPTPPHQASFSVNC